MQDSISKGQGNSRYLKSVANFKALYPTYDDFVAALVAGTLPVDFNGKNPAGWQQEGTELSKANLMSDQSATLFNLSSENVPDDIFDIIGKGLPIRNGGTGATTASGAFYNIVSALSTVSSASSSYYIPMQYSSSGRRISYSNLESALRNSVISSIDIEDLGGCRIVFGQYTGTGYSGEDNPNSITVQFTPKLMGVAPMLSGFNFSDNLGGEFEGGVTIDNVLRWGTSYSNEFGFGSYGSTAYGRRSGNTVYWYNTGGYGPERQFNESKKEYKWFAIG